MYRKRILYVLQILCTGYIKLCSRRRQNCGKYSLSCLKKTKCPLLKAPASWDPLNSCKYMQICRSAMSLKVGQGVEKRGFVYAVFTSSCWLHFTSGTTEDNLKVGRGFKHSQMCPMCSEIQIALSCVFQYCRFSASQVAAPRERKLELES